jgi:hypothetical protein
MNDIEVQDIIYFISNADLLDGQLKVDWSLPSGVIYELRPLMPFSACFVVALEYH